MTPAELKAAGWQDTSRGWRRGYDEIRAVIFIDGACRAQIRIDGDWFASDAVFADTEAEQEAKALSSLGSRVMPDGCTVREWALLPP